uniref:Uncharacterized protein n=1 Tax=Pristionchus pacificus TaxID=54126 RepID=A0A2A6CA39_PRIPA|eukprot:PDM75009.1 hypothetical protein PRIPAC_40390 [Pristionchus pacificus]
MAAPSVSTFSDTLKGGGVFPTWKRSGYGQIKACLTHIILHSSLFQFNKLPPFFFLPSTTTSICHFELHHSEKPNKRTTRRKEGQKGREKGMNGSGQVCDYEELRIVCGKGKNTD